MGTRNMTMVKLGEKIFGQYCQWDGYPEGQGAKVLDFVQSRMDESLLRSRFEAATFIENAEVTRRWESCGAKDGMAGMDAADKFTKQWPHLERAFGAKILDYLQSNEKPELQNSIDFAGDSLFCEWGWLIDLDARELRCFKGFNESPLEDGQPFAHLPPKEQYHPIRLVQSLPFEKLKGMTTGDFVALFVSEEDEDE